MVITSKPIIPPFGKPFFKPFGAEDEAAFSPGDLSPTGWWDATDSADFTFSSGTLISQWDDLSGNANNWVQATVTNQPTLTSGAVVFNGTDNFLGGPDFSALTAAEIFIVIQIDTEPPAADEQTGLWEMGSSNDNTHFPFTDSNIYDGFASSTRKSTGNPTEALTSYVIYNVISTSSEWTSNINGTQHFTTATNTVGWNTSEQFLGRGTNSPPTVFLDGNVKFVIILPTKLSSANRANMVSYLAARFSI